MILDMRGNVGGALDFAQAFLGLFVGGNQYAFDLYHQGDDEVQRTTEPEFPELSRYGEVAVLTDNMTQSTAELTTAVLKRYRIARIVGATTRGWGSVENTYPLKTIVDPSTSYALLLVNSLTLGDTEEPIEQNGVAPDIDTSKTGWQKELSNHFSSPSLIKALENEATAAPMR
jgi:C-terminal processing protease CtpA/Prc